MDDEQFKNLMPEISKNIVNLIISKLKDSQGVRIEDAIFVAAVLAGCYLLKDTNNDLSKLTPGSPVFVDEVNSLGPKIVTLMQRFASELGLNGNKGWDTEVPPNHRPKKSAFDYLAQFESETSSIFESVKFPSDTRAGIMALTTVRLIADGKQILDENIGKAIALQALVEGSKLVPPQT